MVVPVGSLVNAGAVALGGLCGWAAGRVIGDRLRDSLFQVLGLCTILIGLQMALGAENVILVILSCVLGTVAGEALNLAGRLGRAGDVLKKLLRSENDQFTDGLVTTSTIICIGAMSIVGALEEGLGGGRGTLLSKSILDFFVVMMLASVYGSGSVAAAIPLLIYQGGLTLLAGFLAPYVTDGVRSVLTATGGLIIVGIGVNLLGIKKITIENILPALLFAIFLGAFLA